MSYTRTTQSIECCYKHHDNGEKSMMTRTIAVVMQNQQLYNDVLTA